MNRFFANMSTSWKDSSCRTTGSYGTNITRYVVLEICRSLENERSLNGWLRNYAITTDCFIACKLSVSKCLNYNPHDLKDCTTVGQLIDNHWAQTPVQTCLHGFLPHDPLLHDRLLVSVIRKVVPSHLFNVTSTCFNSASWKKRTDRKKSIVIQFNVNLITCY